VDSTTQFINWAKGSLGWSKVLREENERIRREQIARGLPVRYDDKGQPVFACPHLGCEKELLEGPPSMEPGDCSFAPWCTLGRR
jgi:hypothetical protein